MQATPDDILHILHKFWEQELVQDDTAISSVFAQRWHNTGGLLACMSNIACTAAERRATANCSASAIGNIGGTSVHEVNQSFKF